MLKGNLKCPKCGGKVRYKGGRDNDLYFVCIVCGDEFTVIDKGFGYLPMREMIRHEMYPGS